jgi:hypothetical protein
MRITERIYFFVELGHRAVDVPKNPSQLFQVVFLWGKQP